MQGAEPPHATGADPIVALLQALYVSEVYAAVTDAHLCQACDHFTGDQRLKQEALRLLRLETSELIYDHLWDRFGVEAVAPARAEEIAPTLLDLASSSWRDGLVLIEAMATRGVAACRLLRDLHAGAEPLFCASLLVREIARRDFAREELDGREECSLDRIVKLLSREARVALQRFDPDAPEA
jgi:hypothetical protein